MLLRQRLERRLKLADLLVLGLNAKAPAVLLQHVDAGPTVLRIDHQVHRPVGREDLPERAQPGVRIGQVVQHADRRDVIELLPEVRQLLDRELLEAQVREFVLVAQVRLVLEAREIGRAHV
mgnify:CR=1 FL=1